MALPFNSDYSDKNEFPDEGGVRGKVSDLGHLSNLPLLEEHPESPVAPLGDSQYLEGFLPGGDPHRYKSNKQPWTHEAANAVVSGVGGGLLTAVEDIGYILDIQNNVNRLSDMEQVETNMLSAWAKERKEMLTQEMFPIYRKNEEDLIDWSDSAFYWEALRGVLDSAIGFGVVGLGASKAVGIAARGFSLGKSAKLGSSVIRARRKAKFIEELTPYMDDLAAKGQTLTSAYITNFGEGKMMALEMYEQAFDNISAEHPDWSDEKIARLAGESADDFMRFNKVFIMTDAFALSGLSRGLNSTRARARDLSWNAMKKNFGKFSTKNPLAQGLTESGEEIGQNIGQMEARYQAEQKAGVDQYGIPTTLSGRIAHFGLSDQALLEGAMGFFGGPVQYAIIHGPTDLANRKQLQSKVQQQTEQIEKNREFYNQGISNHIKTFRAADEARAKGEQFIAEELEDGVFTDVMYNNFEAGTTDRLENQLIDIKQDKVSAEAKGLSKGYEADIDKMLADLNNAETEYIKMKRLYNSPAYQPFHRAIFSINRKLSLANTRLDGVNSKYNDRLTEVSRVLNEGRVEALHQSVIDFTSTKMERNTLSRELTVLRGQREGIISRNKTIDRKRAAGIKSLESKANPGPLTNSINKLERLNEELNNKISTLNSDVKDLGISFNEEEILDKTSDQGFRNLAKERNLLRTYIAEHESLLEKVTDPEKVQKVYDEAIVQKKEEVKKEEESKKVEVANDLAEDAAAIQAIEEANKAELAKQNDLRTPVVDAGIVEADAITIDTIADLMATGQVKTVDDETGNPCIR